MALKLAGMPDVEPEERPRFSDNLPGKGEYDALLEEMKPALRKDGQTLDLVIRARLQRAHRSDNEEFENRVVFHRLFKPRANGDESWKLFSQLAETVGWESEGEVEWDDAVEQVAEAATGEVVHLRLFHGKDKDKDGNPRQIAKIGQFYP